MSHPCVPGAVTIVLRGQQGTKAGAFNAIKAAAEAALIRAVAGQICMTARATACPAPPPVAVRLCDVTRSRLTFCLR